ncbi:multiheme c-type cytochrome [Shimia biformata]|uniref:multiheme c-type cytochrome n=1 Tax=Shimia biformata TaxID=1294299 RepID=UPI001EF1773D|nr:multiheme c-type cytochrome [Shimia biformata]
MIRVLAMLAVLMTDIIFPAAAQEARPGQSGAGYVGSETCIACHEKAGAAWTQSHHAKAWTKASASNVLADFNGTDYAHDGVFYQFSEADGQYSVRIIGADGTVNEYVVHSVVGIAPLQQYLIETEPGRLQSFDVVWDVEKGGWFHLYPDQSLPPDDGLHWSGPYKNWNARCAECHATGFQKRYSPARDTYASSQAEIGVGCEACHGPGSEHVDWTKTSLPAPKGYGFSMDFASAGTQETIAQCAGCHSRREPFGAGNPVPGTPFDDAYGLAILRPGLYHADGQILDEVYVHGSFLQSKMYAKGVGCMDCHDAHSGAPKAEDNTVCTQCHSPAGNPDFTSLTLKDYDSADHHFHPKGSIGAECKSCHMIERVYMGNDGRRDHSFRIPRPDLSVELGTPNACNDCHDDKGAEWAAAEIAKRYPNAAKRPHFGRALAAGRADPVAARDPLLALSLDGDMPGIARATALWLLSQVPHKEVADTVAPLLRDADPLVRAGAISVQRGAMPEVRAQRMGKLLDDPLRMVRIEAAKTFLDAPADRLTVNTKASLQKAMAEWRATLQARADFPETHMVLGGMALTMRNTRAAEGAFRQVVRMDPQREDAWVMLARIAMVAEGRDKATSVIDEAMAILPDSAALAEVRAQVAAN